MSRVLVVEDEAHLADGLRFNLQAEGHAVEVAADGESALERLVEKRERFDAVVLDPPRIGAAAQAKELARAKVRRIAYVSCNPESFARDARLLTTGGFRLGAVTPVDQFLWSSHIELVACFSRDS